MRPVYLSNNHARHSHSSILCCHHLQNLAQTHDGEVGATNGSELSIGLAPKVRQRRAASVTLVVGELCWPCAFLRSTVVILGHWDAARGTTRDKRLGDGIHGVQLAGGDRGDGTLFAVVTVVGQRRNAAITSYTP